VTREIRSRRLVPSGARSRPLYVRALGLQFVNPSGMLCFVFFEGMIALAVLLALAEQVTWWAVVVLPATVAVMVKINDVVAGALIRSGTAPTRVVGRASVAGASTARASVEPQKVGETRREPRDGNLGTLPLPGQQ
jgi:hypothetical protein